MADGHDLGDCFKRGEWYDPITDIHCQYVDHPWDAHLDELNERYRLNGKFAFTTHGRGLPPPWFNGDIESIRPNEWVLFVSLNPRIYKSDRKGAKWYEQSHFDRCSFWQHWRNFNTDHWYGRFFGPRARLAVEVMGGDPEEESERIRYATRNMLFVELCPYGSGKFALKTKQVEELVATDPGFRLASRVRDILINRRPPALVIVNGNAAVKDFNSVYSHQLTWPEFRYESIDSLSGRIPRKMLRLRKGMFTTEQGVTVPIVGLPFLRSSKTVNSNEEFSQLARLIREHLGSVGSI